MDWQPLDPRYPETFVLLVDGWEVARVHERVDGRGWASTVNRHLRDHRRQHYVVARTAAAGMRWAERWTRPRLARIRSELPFLVPGPAGIRISAYPECNPDPRVVS